MAVHGYRRLWVDIIKKETNTTKRPSCDGMDVAARKPSLAIKNTIIEQNIVTWVSSAASMVVGWHGQCEIVSSQVGWKN